MKLRALPLYAAAHFWVDFSCAALVLGRLDDGGAAVTALLIYNFFAFAVQMPVGLLADALGGARRFSVLGCGLTALAWGLSGLIPAAICAGLGNACFHVGGGLYTLSAGEGCGPLGLFVSPGPWASIWADCSLSGLLCLAPCSGWGFWRLARRWRWQGGMYPACPSPWNWRAGRRTCLR